MNFSDYFNMRSCSRQLAQYCTVTHLNSVCISGGTLNQSIFNAIDRGKGGGGNEKYQLKYLGECIFSQSEILNFQKFGGKHAPDPLRKAKQTFVAAARLEKVFKPARLASPSLQTAPWSLHAKRRQSECSRKIGREYSDSGLLASVSFWPLLIIESLARVSQHVLVTH